jgi:predicted negative regulator of RcsB-dependent stress response
MSSRTSKRTGGIVTLAILIGLGIGGWLYQQRNPKTTSSETQTELQQIVSKVSAHAVVPTDEEPALYTVVDKDQQQQAFFAAAQNGDKVLIYTGIRKAILYRPSTDRIVEMAPLVVTASAKP